MDENKQSIENESTQIQAPAQTTAQTPAPTQNSAPQNSAPKQKLGLSDLFYEVDIFTMIIIILTVLGTIVATVGAIVTAFS